MQSPSPANGAVADASVAIGWIAFAPDWLKPYARLAMGPSIGFWLLFWPCGFALALAPSPARFL